MLPKYHDHGPNTSASASVTAIMCHFLSFISCFEASVNKMSSPSGQTTMCALVWHWKCFKRKFSTNFRGCGFRGRLSVVRHSRNFVTWPQMPHWNKQKSRQNWKLQKNAFPAINTSMPPSWQQWLQLHHEFRKARLRICGHTESNPCEPITIDLRPHIKQLQTKLKCNDSIHVFFCSWHCTHVPAYNRIRFVPMVTICGNHGIWTHCTFVHAPFIRWVLKLWRQFGARHGHFIQSERCWN